MNSGLEDFLAGKPKMKASAKQKIAERFSFVQDIVSTPAELAAGYGNWKRLRGEAVEWRLRNPFRDRPPVFIGCANIAKLRWCHYEAIFKCIRNEAEFKSAYEADVRKYGSEPNYDEILREIHRNFDEEREAKNRDIAALFSGAFTGRASDPFSRGLAAEAEHAELYPKARFFFSHSGMTILGIPDGVTDEFCYEFKTSESEFIARHFVLPVAKSQAHLYAYFLKRPRIRVQIYIRQTDQVATYESAADRAHAEGELQKMAGLFSGQLTPTPTTKAWKCRSCDFNAFCPACKKD